MLYAIAKIQGKQYKLVEGKELNVDRLPDEVGQAVNVDEVLLVAQGDNCLIGEEAKKAKIRAVVVEELKDKKILVLKYKKRKRYRKLTGHRQHLTLLKVEKIDFIGKKAEKQISENRNQISDEKKDKKQKTDNKKIEAKNIEKKTATKIITTKESVKEPAKK